MIALILLINALFLFVYMTVVFVLAERRGRLDTVDIAWGPAFLMVAWLTAVIEVTPQSFVIAILVTIWGLRLAFHIGLRAKKKSDDPRYTELTKKWKGDVWRRAYISIFLLQGALVWIISLPIVMASGEQLSGWSWLTWLGGIIWLKGYLIEVAADRQLREFLSDKDHPKVLQTGLWHYSRHPNYFGELTQWWGIGVIALQASYGWVGLIGPIALTILIVYVSGIPPIERRRQEDHQYREYQRKTSPLIPLPPHQ
ncbi:MAG: DUF1295 domain-containing protein [Patescibacteria group bacterium]